MPMRLLHSLLLCNINRPGIFRSYLSLPQASISIDGPITGLAQQISHPRSPKRSFEGLDFVATSLLRAFKRWTGNVDREFYHVCHACLHQDLPCKFLVEMWIEEGPVEKAFSLYVRLIDGGVVNAEDGAFLAIAKSCAAKNNNKLAEKICAYLLEIAMPIYAHLGNVLLNLRFKSDPFDVDDVWRLVDVILDRDVITWTIMISGQCKKGKATKAMMLFEQMKEEGANPDAMACVGVLAACVQGGNLVKGRHVHVCILSMGLSNNVHIANTLIDLYATLGRIEESQRVFDEMASQDAISWNILISGNAKLGNHEEAIRMFWRMYWDGHNWTDVTFLNILDSLGDLGDLNLCRYLHVIILALKLKSTTFVENALIHTYSKCGSIVDARRIFTKIRKPDVAAWTAMTTGYMKHGQHVDAWNCYLDMVKRGFKPNEITYVNVLNACTSLGQVEKVHKHIHEVRITPNIFMGNALLTMYAKFGRLDFGLQVFDQMPLRNVVSWTSVISAYMKNGHIDAACQVFQSMEFEGVQPNEVTFVCMLSVCTALECLELGQRFHDYVVQFDFELVAAINNSLMDMYMKCGNLEEAYHVLSKQSGMTTWASCAADYSL